MDEAAAQQQLANAHRHHHIKPLGGHWLTHFTVDSQLLLHFLLLLRHLLLLSTFFLLHPDCYGSVTLTAISGYRDEMAICVCVCLWRGEYVPGSECGHGWGDKEGMSNH